jgi:hypothetical protein
VAYFYGRKQFSKNFKKNALAERLQGLPNNQPTGVERKL